MPGDHRERQALGFKVAGGAPSGTGEHELAELGIEDEFVAGNLDTCGWCAVAF
jgi:hypothetical protein